MDYGRKIGKEDVKPMWTKVFTPTTTVQDGLISQDEPLSEDRRLKNWSKWLAKRKIQYNHIEARTGRDGTNQVLNSSEMVRSFREMKTLMDYANEPVPLKTDKYRGGPEFWKLPLKLRSRNEAPEIFAVPTKKDLNTRPELLYVGTPALINKEKSLTSTNTKEPRWKQSEYLNKRRKELAGEIKLLVPKEPEMEDLVVQGRGPRLEIMEPSIPLITISSPEEHQDEEEESNENHVQDIILKIQDRELMWRKDAFKSEEIPAEPLTWSLRFTGKRNKRLQKEIVFENKGNRVIVYQWRDVLREDGFSPLKSLVTPFFFNKTKGVILPGQFVHLKIWFRPLTAGIFTESWKLLTEPRLCPSDLLFRFWGHADGEIPSQSNFVLKSESVDVYLDGCVRDSTIRHILNEIIEGPGEIGGGLQCNCHATDAEIFQCKNRFSFYNPDLLIRLRSLYRKVVKGRHSPWNLSLAHLKQIILKVDEPTQKEAILTEFRELCEQSTNPSRSYMYRMVYGALSSFFSLLESVSKHARQLLEEGMAISEMEGAGESPDISQASLMNNTSPGRLKQTLSNRTLNSEAQDIPQRQDSQRNLSTDADDETYRETILNRTHELLINTITEICEIIDTCKIACGLNLINFEKRVPCLALI